MHDAAEDMALRLYGKASFSLACHMSLYKVLRENGFIDFKKLLVGGSQLNEIEKPVKSKSVIKNNCHTHPLRIKQLNCNIIKNHGINLEQKNKLLNRQNNLCAICGRNFIKEPDYYMSIDHNHITGKIRGIICGNCNKGIGFLKADSGIEILKKAIKYIEVAQVIDRI